MSYMACSVPAASFGNGVHTMRPNQMTNATATREARATPSHAKDADSARAIESANARRRVAVAAALCCSPFKVRLTHKTVARMKAMAEIRKSGSNRSKNRAAESPV